MWIVGFNDFKKYILLWCHLCLGGDAPLLDGITADGQDGVSFVHPMGKIFLQPLAGQALSNPDCL